MKDPYDKESPRHTWKVRLTLREAEAKLGSLVKGRLRRITVVRRGVSPRIVRARVVGSRGSTEVTGATLRQRFGLDDTWARFSLVTTTARRRAVTRTVAAPAPGQALRAFGLPVTPADGGQFHSWASFDAAAQAAGTGAPVPASAPAPASPRTVRVRIRELRGTLTGRRRPVALRVQRRSGDGDWQTVRTIRTGKRGRYVARVTRPGVYRVQSRGVTGPPVRMP